MAAGAGETTAGGGEAGERRSESAAAAAFSPSSFPPFPFRSRPVAASPRPGPLPAGLPPKYLPGGGGGEEEEEGRGEEEGAGLSAAAAGMGAGGARLEPGTGLLSGFLSQKPFNE